MKNSGKKYQYRTFLDELIELFKDDIPGEIKRWGIILRYFLILIPFAILFIVGFIFYIKPYPIKPTYLGTGQPGSSYFILSEQFQKYFKKHDIDLKLVQTPGLDQGLKELSDDKFIVSASFLTAGIATPGQYPNLVSLGSIQYSPLWLFYRGQPQETKDLVSFLKDKKIAVGQPGTNTLKMFMNLLETSGYPFQPSDQFLQLPHAEAVKQFEEGKIDAVFIIDGIESPSVKRLLSVKDVEIFDLELIDAYVKKMPYLVKLQIPEGSISIKDTLPNRNVDILASTVTLLVEADTHPVVQWLFLKAAKEIGSSHDQFFAKPGFFPAHLDDTVALSPIAKQYYTSGFPQVLDYFPLWLGVLIDRFWVLILTVLALGLPLIKLLSSVRNFPAQKLIAEYYKDLWDIEFKLIQAQTLEDTRQFAKEVESLDLAVQETWFDDGERRDFFTLRRRIDGVIGYAEKKIRQLEKSPSTS